MDIGLVKRSFRLQGGGERQIGYLIDGLLAQGHAVHLFSEQPPLTEPPEGLMYHTLPAIPAPHAFRALGFALVVRSSLRRADLAVVQSFDRTLGQQIYRAGEGVHREWLQRKRRSLPALARGWAHLSLFNHVMLALERRVFCKTPRIVANSQRGRQEITHHYSVSPRRMLTIYNGVDTDRFNADAGRRVREIQRAAWGVRADDLVLLYVGSGFHRTDVEQCYAGADLFVLPTLYDPFANACLEAMACGLPVLTTVANGAAELLRNGVNGWVLGDAPSAEALADAIQCLLPWERRMAMGRAAQETASEYPLSRVLMHTLQLYEAVAKQTVAV